MAAATQMHPARRVAAHGEDADFLGEQFGPAGDAAHRKADPVAILGVDDGEEDGDGDAGRGLLCGDTVERCKCRVANDAFLGELPFPGGGRTGVKKDGPQPLDGFVEFVLAGRARRGRQSRHPSHLR